MQQFSPIKFRATKYIGIYLGIILIIISFGTGVVVGHGAGLTKGSADSAGQAVATEIYNIDRTTARVKEVNFNQFWDVWDRVKAKYVKKGEVKESDMFYGAIEGMVAALGDPYSTYFPPQQAADFMKSLTGQFEGIGAEIGIKNNFLVVVAPLADSPAERAGLKAGDKILAIDKVITSGMDVNSAVSKIRGPAGTLVVLTVAREGQSKAIEIKITRAKINVPPVTMKMKPGNVAYIRVMQFNDQTIPEFEKYIGDIQRVHASGLILDLRNNPGGYLDAAVTMGSKWVEDGRIVSEKFSDGTENIHSTIGSHPLSKLKTVVLVNGGSASASEIVSGALQDYKLGTIIGEKTFGKGSVQDYENFSDGSALKITVAEWYTPHGNNINQKGITPDIAVKEDFANEKVGEDVMVNAALDVLAGRPVRTSTPSNTTSTP